MTQELYQEAMKFAGEKHSNQKVPGTNANYLLHISNVAMEVLMAYFENKNFDINTAIQIAILHDVLEDTDTTFDEIAKKFGTPIANGVQSLTKDHQLESKIEKMNDSLERINLMPKEIGIVKLADRITNLQKPPISWSAEKIRLYFEESKSIANALSDKNEYLFERLKSKIKAYENFKINP